jgi:hypothetical protein
VTIQSADLDEDGFSVRRWHCVLQRRAFMRIPRNRGPAGRLAVEYRELRSNLFGNGVNDGQLPDLAKRSVTSLIHFARTTLRDDHETTAGEVLNRGSAAPSRLDQLYSRDIGGGRFRSGSDRPDL